jgi:LuxR family maltose regulon positive regulatory protein
MPGTFPMARAMQAASRTLFSIRRDDLKAATEWGVRLEEYADVLPLHSHHIRGRLLIAQGNKKKALSLLQDLYDRYARVGGFGYMITLLVHLALAADSQEHALTFLTEALTLGEPRGYIRSFVDEAELLKPLLRRALDKGITPDYTRKLLDIIDAEELQQQVRSRTVAPGKAWGTLSERELEILGLLAAGLSNRQISERLVISLGTAKTHVHNISEKLDTKTRTQAIARARELKLV